jgi:signal transduction histidine kinase
MNRFLQILLIGAMAALTSFAVCAAERGSSEEAIALVKKAIAFYKANGREKTIEEANNPKGKFTSKDLYVFVSTVKQGPTLGHPNAKLVGKEMVDLKDIDGVHFVRKFREVANSKEGFGWVDYKWPNPATNQIEKKSTYIERADELYFGCGIYKE